MNEEQEKPDATKSICWNCQHGMCVQETQRNHLIHGGMPNFGQPEQDSMDGFNIDSFGGDEDESSEIFEYVIEEETVKTICFWRPQGIEHAPPIAVAHVDKCNRFEKNKG